MANDVYLIRFNAEELKTIGAIIAAHQDERDMRALVKDGVTLAMNSQHIDALLSYIEPELAREDAATRTKEEKATWVQLTRIADKLVNVRLK